MRGFDGVQQSREIRVGLCNGSDRGENLIDPEKADKKNWGNEVGFKQQIGQQAQGNAQKEYAGYAFNVETFHCVQLRLFHNI